MIGIRCYQHCYQISRFKRSHRHLHIHHRNGKLGQYIENGAKAQGMLNQNIFIVSEFLRAVHWILPNKNQSMCIPGISDSVVYHSSCRSQQAQSPSANCHLSNSAICREKHSAQFHWLLPLELAQATGTWRQAGVARSYPQKVVCCIYSRQLAIHFGAETAQSLLLVSQSRTCDNGRIDTSNSDDCWRPTFSSVCPCSCLMRKTHRV